MSDPRNNIEYQGKRFYMALIDSLDGHIYETVTYEKAKKVNFMHSDFLSFRSLEDQDQDH